MEQPKKITQRIIKLPEVIAQTGLSRSSIYAKIDEGTFPPSVSLGARAVGFVEAEIQAWIEEKISSAR
jgi:prophage regulatory protein